MATVSGGRTRPLRVCLILGSEAASSAADGSAAKVQVPAPRLAATVTGPRRTMSQPGFFVVFGLDAVEAGVGERRDLPAKSDQPAIPGQKAGVAALAGLGPVEPGALERRRVLRIGHVVRVPAEGGELAGAALR